jgi:hypothetical protein
MIEIGEMICMDVRVYLSTMSSLSEKFLDVQVTTEK